MTETASMTKVYGELKRIEETMATKEDLQALGETIEILSNPTTVKQIAESLRDIREGKEKEISSVQEMLDEM